MSKALKPDQEADTLSRTPKYEPKVFENRKILEYTPVKYNGKMMNR